MENPGVGDLERSPDATEPAIELDHLSKVYHSYRSAGDRFRRLLGRPHAVRHRHALRDVHLAIPRGQAVGIVGENGSGKSTLLKAITGTTGVTLGTVRTRGSIASILELGAGFHPEYSGLENARLYAALVGVPPERISSRLEEIVSFAELGDAVRDPVKTYSTGMTMRLGFAVATHVDADVLVVDEALAVGDGYFQKKCVDRMLEIKGSGTTILFCTHSMYLVTSLCERAVWLRDGAVVADGPAADVVAEYERYLLARERRRLDRSAPTAAPGRLAAVSAVRVNGVEPVAELDQGDDLEVEVDVELADPSRPIHLGVVVQALDGRELFGASSMEAAPPLSGRDRQTAAVRFPEIPLAGGVYSLVVYVLDDTGLCPHDQVVVPEAFRVRSDRWRGWLVDLPSSWRTT